MSQLPYKSGFESFNIPGLRRGGKAERQRIQMGLIRSGLGSSTNLQSLLSQQRTQEDEQVRYMQHLRKRKRGGWKGLLASAGGSLLGGLLGGPVGAGIGGSLASGLFGGGGGGGGGYGGGGGGLMQQIGTLGGGQSGTSPFMQLLGLLGGGGGRKTPVSSIPGYEQFGLNRKQRLGLGGFQQGRLPQLYGGGS